MTREWTFGYCVGTGGSRTLDGQPLKGRVVYCDDWYKAEDSPTVIVYPRTFRHAYLAMPLRCLREATAREIAAREAEDGGVAPWLADRLDALAAGA